MIRLLGGASCKLCGKTVEHIHVRRQKPQDSAKPPSPAQ